MRSKNLVLLTLVLLMLSPIVAVSSRNAPDYTYFSTDDWDSSVGVTPGLTIKYTINELVVPEIENLTIPDLAGNQLYVKVMSVENDYAFFSEVGVLIRYGMGIIFTNDVTITIGEEGFNALDITVPTGSATPATVLAGIPHFDNALEDTTPFFLNNDWTEHEINLEAIGFTVTNSADEFTTTFTNGTGTLAGTWRKSDGILTSLSIDDINFMGTDFTGGAIDISLISTEDKGLEIAVGDEIILNNDIASLDITGAGELYELVNQTELTSIQSEFESMKDLTMAKFIVTEVEGLYYKCEAFIYDYETASLVPTDEPIIFNGFLGAIDQDPPMLYESLLDIYTTEGLVATASFISGVAPVITPDFDIYGGYLVLADTIVDVYLDELFDLMLSGNLSELTINTIDGDFFMSEKRDYVYLQESINADITYDFEGELNPLSAEMSISLDIDATIQEEGWLAYHESGVVAGMRLKLDVTIQVTSPYTISGIPTGQLTIQFDFKVTNEDYNPPDPLGGGVIPGYTWIVAIPALLGLAAVGLISRRRK